MSPENKRLGSILWITGLPASGKTTLARSMVEAIQARGQVTLWLDSDDLRKVLTPQATYSDQERDLFYASIAHIAYLAAQGGAVAIISATATKRAYRDALREKCRSFAEIFLKGGCQGPARQRSQRPVSSIQRGSD